MGYYDPPEMEDPPCETCGNHIDDCVCPECQECGDVGNLMCYREYGLKYTAEQIEGIEHINQLRREEAEREEEWARQILDVPDYEATGTEPGSEDQVLSENITEDWRE